VSVIVDIASEFGPTVAMVFAWSVVMALEAMALASIKIE